MARREACLKSIIANLALFHLFPAPHEGVAVPLRKDKKTRYDRAGFTADVLRNCVMDLEASGFVETIPGAYRQRRTLVIPKADLRTSIEQRNVCLSDIGREDGKETVHLRTRRRGNRSSEPVDYADTSETVAMRTAMGKINESLNATPVCYDGVSIPPQHLIRMFTLSDAKELAFGLHGRLYGGFWQSLPKGLRHKLTIGGTNLADVDFQGMFLQLAYGRVGTEVVEGDPYAIAGLEGHRATVKQLAVSLFFRDGMARRFPRGVRLPAPWTMPQFVSAMSERHPALVPLFGTDVGFRLMHTESEILVSSLLELASRDITALPMHDGLMVAETHRSVAMAVMAEAAREKLGRALPVIEKPILRPVCK